MAAQQQLARISILGVGKMGAASARRLAGLGYDVRVLATRSAGQAEALAQTIPLITVSGTALIGFVETADLCIALLSTTDAVKAVVEAAAASPSTRSSPASAMLGLDDGRGAPWPKNGQGPTRFLLTAPTAALRSPWSRARASCSWPRER